ncbi:cysteine-rich receptor-like protein kinase 8 [Amaranthus tricolor]|uniref:cysteine-rich receptor-like protein kinase 8 n=1 Tax=Amaranthus tricolor TaxID=29722 RepID=UPI0025839F4B|nr:cysteine-rich receptor-like protein kinase 8 [Amaranthus tricolor]
MECYYILFLQMKVILSLILLALQILRGDAAPYYVGYNCPVNGFPYSAGSTFQDNLNATLFIHLVANASRAAYSTYTMGEGVDQVYAMYYCKGDVSLAVCHDCVQTAAVKVLDVCKLLKQGIVWYKECTLRYANRTIFSFDTQDLEVKYPFFNYTPILADYLDEYRSIYDASMRNLIDQAANNASLKPRGFATSRVKLSSYQSLRGVAQCAPILSGRSCQTCLNGALISINLWSNCIEFLPTCFIGFDIYGLPPPTPPSPAPSLPVHYKVLIPLLSIVVVGSLVGFWFWKCRSSKGDPHPPSPNGKEKQDFFINESDEYDQSIGEDYAEPSEKGKPRGLAQFTYAEIEDMTIGFQHKLGEGGFAVVYHGTLPYRRREVAVKLFSKNEAPKQFSTEIEVLGRISHKNLVSLVGYCEEGTNLALVYEYMAMGDLKALLTEDSDKLSWRIRVKIAIDTAQGLDYLHNGCSPPIVHRDVKPANILLNKDLRAKVSDFGFSKIFPAEYVSNLQSRVVGTLGYLDPQ